MAGIDRQTLGELYDRYGAMVFRRCRDILGDEQAALDAMQDVFVRALRAEADFRGEASPVTWLYRISTNLCLNRLRDGRGRARKLEQARAGAQDGDETPIAGPAILGSALPGPAALERQMLVRSLLERADDETRRIAIYYYYDGLTLEEICPLVGLSRPTVAARLEAFRERARRQLRVGDPGLTLALLALTVHLLELRHG